MAAQKTQTKQVIEVAEQQTAEDQSVAAQNISLETTLKAADDAEIVTQDTEQETPMRPIVTVVSGVSDVLLGIQSVQQYRAMCKELMPKTADEMRTFSDLLARAGQIINVAQQVAQEVSATL